MNSEFIADYYYNFNEKWKIIPGCARIIKNYWLRYLLWNRIYQNCNSKIVKIFALFMANRTGKKYGLEMEFRKDHIAGGLVLIHPHGITVNSEAYLGSNVVLFKGVTIGSVRSGKRKGVPCIGDHVVIGCNAFVCGGISVGEDVLIAANAFVDFDVPSHSIVIGNPGIIKRKPLSTIDYCLLEKCENTH